MKTNLKHTLVRAALGGLFAVATIGAQAANFDFSGNLVNNTDRVSVTFDLASASDVSMWTDSWNNGVNFDAVSALWVRQGNDYALVQENDDAVTAFAGAGYYDTGMSFTSLAAGHYLLTVGPSFSEPYAAGTLLSQGFVKDKDGTTPTAIAQWNQPSYDLNANDQKGTFYSLKITGVDSATISAVPEPSSLAMLLVGLGLVGQIAARRHQKRA